VIIIIIKINKINLYFLAKFLYMKEEQKKEEEKDAKDCMTFKIITLGDSYVGKTALLKKYVTNVFDESVYNTIGMNISFKTITLKNNKKIELKLVDTAGTEKYKSLSKQYFKNTDGVLFIFAHDNPDSFDHITLWMKIFSEEKNKKYIPKFLVGNKNDLENKVLKDDIKDFLKKNKDFKYKSVSAKMDDIKINELFQELGEQLYKSQANDNKGKKSHINLVEKYDKNKNTTCFLVRCMY
jgi:small GTP-binding protein